MEKFTKKESMVMDVLWETGKPMTARDIAAKIPGFSIYSVQQVLTRLLDNGAVVVTGITRYKKSIARQYKPTVEEADYLASITNNRKTGLLFTENFVDQAGDLTELTELRGRIEARIRELSSKDS